MQEATRQDTVKTTFKKSLGQWKELNHGPLSFAALEFYCREPSTGSSASAPSLPIPSSLLKQESSFQLSTEKDSRTGTIFALIMPKSQSKSSRTTKSPFNSNFQIKLFCSCRQAEVTHSSVHVHQTLFNQGWFCPAWAVLKNQATEQAQMLSVSLPLPSPGCKGTAQGEQDWTALRVSLAL